MTKEPRELATVEYEGYAVTAYSNSSPGWDYCIVHSPGSDDYFYDGAALDCFQWINNRIEILIDATRAKYLKSIE